MEVMKVPEFGSRFNFPENENFEFEDNSVRMIGKLYAGLVEQYEDAVIAEIANAARACGASECLVLNKKAIMDALMKQKPQDVILTHNGTFCPTCHLDMIQEPYVRVLEYRCPRHCPECGQKLKWRICNDDD